VQLLPELTFHADEDSGSAALAVQTRATAAKRKPYVPGTGILHQVNDFFLADYIDNDPSHAEEHTGISGERPSPRFIGKDPVCRDEYGNLAGKIIT
jgi:hypothetical protein